MVAGDRSGFDSRQDEDELISLGVWRIKMLKSMKKYVDQIKEDLERTKNKSTTENAANEKNSGSAAI
ncbi:hypothetical protein EGT36_23365 [Agrobacterium sp. FDAARGOS_525]|uniref:hypothetical protein n=1 Tax=Agrobacterium pusense TaxID=648995 RepID=UPI000FAD773E|nr:hypothetical protein [Agrobacterium pusense]RSC31554.1 hypothetical protein EGT36_23365 [Agrobacterium sp. FDAARGOS_525]